MPSEPFQLSLPGFEGPLDVLVRQFESGRVPLDQLALAQVSGQFFAWAEDERDIDLETTGEFLRNAARLLVLKSSFLLLEPAESEAEAAEDSSPRYDIEALRAASMWIAERSGYPSAAGAARAALVERAVEPRSAAVLPPVWESMVRRRGRGLRVVVPMFVRLEQAVSSIMHRISSRGSVSLRAILRGGSRTDAVMHFLAVLELVRRRRIEATQSGIDADIVLAQVRDGAADSRAG